MNKDDKNEIIYKLKDLDFNEIDNGLLNTCINIVENQLFFVKYYMILSEYCNVKGKYDLALKMTKKASKEILDLLGEEL